MKERDIIAALRSGLSTRNIQQGNPFDRDAEIIEIDGVRFAFSCDEFSDEDGMPTDNPRQLGWNLVTATFSDIIAAGAKPLHLMQSFAVAKFMDEAWLKEFSRGAESALCAFDATLLGGDVGTADCWRCTGFAVGVYDNDHTMRNRIAVTGNGKIFVSGRIGDGNLAAARMGGCPMFECRLKEAHLRGITACMDTSDGLANALQTLSEVNPHIKFEWNAEATPYAPEVRNATRDLGLPLEIFALGSAGEYELLVLAPGKNTDYLIANGFTCIGEFTEDAVGGLFINHRRQVLRMSTLPDPRDFASRSAYITTLSAYCLQLLAGEAR